VGGRGGGLPSNWKPNTSPRPHRSNKTMTHGHSLPRVRGPNSTAKAGTTLVSSYTTAVWARTPINEGMFMYSLSVALIHRPDTYYFSLPPIYEIYPHYFYSTTSRCTLASRVLSIMTRSSTPTTPGIISTCTRSNPFRTTWKMLVSTLSTTTTTCTIPSG
jgi:hypothetical protein